MVDLEFSRQSEDGNLLTDTNTFPAQNCNHESYDDIPVSWKFSSRHEDTGAATMQLLWDSWKIFRNMSLQDWADDVLDMPSTKVKLFKLYYSRLAFSLFSFLRRVPKEISKYDSMASVRTLSLSPAHPD